MPAVVIYYDAGKIRKFGIKRKDISILSMEMRLKATPNPINLSSLVNHVLFTSVFPVSSDQSD